jgi:hypothetical protein
MKKKTLRILAIAAVLALLCAVPALADGTGDVSGAVEGTWNEAAGQLKTIVNKVVFPALDAILAVFFFVKVGTCYFDYRKHGQFDWSPPAILLACLIFTLTAPTYIWGIGVL